MKRFYLSKIKRVLSPILGDFCYVHRLQEIGWEQRTNFTCAGGEIDVDPRTGEPKQKAIMVAVDAQDHRVFANDPELVPVPAAALQAATSHRDADAFRARLSDVGLEKSEADALFEGASSMRDVVERLGKLNNPRFDSTRLGVE